MSIYKRTVDKIRRLRRGILAVTAVFLFVSFAFSSCQAAGLLFTENGEIECGGDGKAIILDNNPAAVNPTFDELIAFIKSDPTDTRDYIADGADAYVCADFAEDVHNNAETAGIRAAWVGITFENTLEGHAINAFETTDKGLVYIDCTSGGRTHDENGSVTSWDTIAYVQIGSKYGVIHVDRAASLGYNYYVEYEEAWQSYRDILVSYNSEVDEYNSEIEGKVFTLGSPEALSIEAWRERLDEQSEILYEMEKELGTYWYESEFSQRIVANTLIHW
jgi:hypothetical protein